MNLRVFSWLVNHVYRWLSRIFMKLNSYGWLEIIFINLPKKFLVIWYNRFFFFIFFFFNRRYLALLNSYASKIIIIIFYSAGDINWLSSLPYFRYKLNIVLSVTASDCILWMHSHKIFIPIINEVYLLIHDFNLFGEVFLI